MVGGSEERRGGRPSVHGGCNATVEMAAAIVTVMVVFSHCVLVLQTPSVSGLHPVPIGDCSVFLVVLVSPTRRMRAWKRMTSFVLCRRAT